MSKEILKIYFPFKDDPEKLLPIEVDIIHSGDFNKSLLNIKNNFTMFVAKILEENSDLEVETDIDKCKFEKVTFEEIDINAL